jgi:VWFA-related protein
LLRKPNTPVRKDQEAVRFFVDQLRPQDRFALICFADDQVSWVTEFTSDRERFLDRLNVQEGYGRTALNDAVAAIPKLVDESTSGRKAIVLITDGVDNASKLSVEQSVVTARKVEVPIFTVGFTTLPWEDRKKAKDLGFNMAVLQMFADQTGGALFVVKDPDEMKEAVEQIKSSLQKQQAITRYLGDFLSAQVEKVWVEMGGKPFLTKTAELDEHQHHARAHGGEVERTN